MRYAIVLNDGCVQGVYPDRETAEAELANAVAFGFARRFSGATVAPHDPSRPGQYRCPNHGPSWMQKESVR